ncbi:MAG: hypothetical protein ACK2UO_03740 [Caldilineaceae bacterium]
MANNGKKVYIPYMGDHSHLMEAVLTAMDVQSEVLPESNEASAMIGLDLVLGKECSPCMYTVGDMIQRSKRPDFVPEESIMLMATAPGPCRFGQYNVLQAQLLAEQGLGAVEVMSPTSGDGYRGLGDDPTKFRMLAWDAVVTMDLLQQLLHRYRPYEINEGDANDIYARGLERILIATRDGGSELKEAITWIGKQYESMPQVPDQDKPIIGVIGEIYVRFTPYANQNIILRVEELEGEVVLASMMEWLYLTTWNPAYYAWIKGNRRESLVHKVTEYYQRYREHKFTKTVEHLLRHPYEKSTGELRALLKPYLEPDVQTEAVMSLAKAVELAHDGASGILAVMPFSCMPGLITAAIAPRVRRDLNNIPWLDLSFDLQKSTNVQTRLEAFMYQAQHFQRLQREMAPAA